MSRRGSNPGYGATCTRRNRRVAVLWALLAVGQAAAQEPDPEPQESQESKAGKVVVEDEAWSAADYAQILAALLGMGGIGGLGVRYGPGLMAAAPWRNRREEEEPQPVRAVRVAPEVDAAALEALAQRAAADALHRAMEQIRRLEHEIGTLRKEALTPAQAVDIARGEVARAMQARRLDEVEQQVVLLRQALDRAAPSAGLLAEVLREIQELRGEPEPSILPSSFLSKPQPGVQGGK